MSTLLKGRRDRHEWGGGLEFSRSYGSIGRVEYAMRVDPEKRIGWLAVRHSRQLPWGGVDAVEPYGIELEATPQPLGGLRWWFVCPVSRRRCCRLFLPYGARKFGARQAYQLGYASQRMSPRDKGIERVRKLQKRIGGGDNILAPIPPKPKWMRWRTYARHVAMIEEAHRPVLATSMAAIESLRRLQR